jgi:hypothetical protein
MAKRERSESNKLSKIPEHTARAKSKTKYGAASKNPLTQNS